MESAKENKIKRGPQWGGGEKTKKKDQEALCRKAAKRKMRISLAWEFKSSNILY